VYKRTETYLGEKKTAQRDKMKEYITRLKLEQMPTFSRRTSSQVIREADRGQRSRIRMVQISLLRGHERLDAQHLLHLKAEIKSDGILKRPIAVDVNTNVVLDGHHRIGALRLLGCSRIPVLYVDYESPKIGVKTAENGKEYPKRNVIEAGLKGELLHPKSTWHYVTFSREIAHISQIEERVDAPLEDLK
jgi:ParB-like chromosome segregation protein Spo0J